MSLFNRAAMLAAIIGIFGVTGVSTPGRASELDHTALPVVKAQTSPILPNPSVPATDDVTAPTVDDDGYASLAEAVADQSMPDQLDDELRCLAEAVYYEAKGEPLSGQLAVAKVILNRTESGRFPRSVCSVVRQAGQFSFVRDGVVPDAPRDSTAFRTAVAIAQVAMNDDWDSDAGDALYFHARRVAPSWRMTRVAAIGNHVFYR